MYNCDETLNYIELPDIAENEIHHIYTYYNYIKSMKYLNT